MTVHRVGDTATFSFYDPSVRLLSVAELAELAGAVGDAVQGFIGGTVMRRRPLGLAGDSERGSATPFALLVGVGAVLAVLGAATVMTGGGRLGLALMAASVPSIVAAVVLTVRGDHRENAARHEAWVSSAYMESSPAQQRTAAPAAEQGTQQSGPEAEASPWAPPVEVLDSQAGSAAVGIVVVVFIVTAALMPALDAITPAVTR